MQYEDILFEVADGVATITINRPKVMNAFRGRTCEELIHAFNRAGWDKAVGVIVLTGTGGEAPLVAEVAGAMRAPSLDLAGKTTLGGLAALVARARLVVCNDTGLSHLAAALHTPSVVVACGSDTRRWAPENRTLHSVLANHPSCRPCSHRICPTGHECAIAVSVSPSSTSSRPPAIGISRASARESSSSTPSDSNGHSTFSTGPKARSLATVAASPAIRRSGRSCRTSTVTASGGAHKRRGGVSPRRASIARH